MAGPSPKAAGGKTGATGGETYVQQPKSRGHADRCAQDKRMGRTGGARRQQGCMADEGERAEGGGAGADQHEEQCQRSSNANKGKTGKRDEAGRIPPTTNHKEQHTQTQTLTGHQHLNKTQENWRGERILQQQPKETEKMARKTKQQTEQEQE